MKKMIYAGIVVLMVGLFVLTGCTKKEEQNNLPAKKASAVNKVEQEDTTPKKKNAVNKDFDYLDAADKQMADPVSREVIAIMHVQDYGDIYIKFFPDVAPKAVENFVEHAREGYYDGVSFHRVIEQFMIQGGDPEGTGSGGESIWGKDFEEEIGDSVKPYRGALCMASRGSKNSPSLGSQFYIVQAQYRESIVSTMKALGATDSMIAAYEKYGGDLYDLFFYDYYTVFGQVYKGMDVVDKIAMTETDEDDKPIKDVIIKNIEITKHK